MEVRQRGPVRNVIIWEGSSSLSLSFFLPPACFSASFFSTKKKEEEKELFSGKLNWEGEEEEEKVFFSYMSLSLIPNLLFLHDDERGSEVKLCFTVYRGEQN